MTAILNRNGPESVMDGEFVMTAEDFRCIAAIIRKDAGIILSEQKVPLVYARIAKRLRALRVSSFSEYCRMVESPGGAEERGELVTALTTNVTRFFREPHHFEHLATAILPSALASAKRGGRVRIWSSACSTGQEAYSIALTVLRLMPDAPKLDIRILASDINANVVAEARRGVYDAQLAKDIPQELRRRWMVDAEDEPGSLAMTAPVQALVEFRNLNLIKPWPMRSAYQAIFCRNVMIYFDAETQSNVWSKMLPLLPGGGALYIGHSERVSGPAAQHLRSDGITTYRRISPGT